MVQWLSPKSIFGPHNRIVEGHRESWAIGRMCRLVGPIGPTAKSEYEKLIGIGKHFSTGTFIHPETKIEQPFMTLGTVREEMLAIPEPKVADDLISFIEYLLVVDHLKRPTAAEALNHPYLRSLE